MSVSNAHLEETHRVWDGLSFRMLPKAEARKLAKEGVAQIADDLQASQLKTAAQFDEARQDKVDTGVELPPGVEQGKKVTGGRKKRTYNTRQMKANG